MARLAAMEPIQDADQERLDLLKREFVRNVAHPDLDFDQTPRTSDDYCDWRCSTCEHEWPAQIRFRTRKRKPTNCPECFRRRNRAPGPGESLAETDPNLASEFVRNLRRPDRDPASLRPQSHDMCEWTCELKQPAHVYPATVANRTNGRGCPDCGGHGRSYFECKVAALIEAASGLATEVDHRVRLKERREDRFDLFIPQAALLVDLDPRWSHDGPDSLVRDAAKSTAALNAGLDLIRIREHPLPSIAVPGLSCYHAGPVTCPEGWADAVGEALRLRGHRWQGLDAEQKAQALAEAAERWLTAVAAPAVSALDKAPHLAGEFVANLTSPGRTLDQMTAGCNDICAWTCAVCGHPWRAPVAARALEGYGCQPCGIKRTAASNAKPGRGESLAEVNPKMAAELVEVVDHSGWTAQDILPHSNKPCRWKCSAPGCGHEWGAPPNRRSACDGGGCEKCGRKRTVAAIVRPKPGYSLLDQYPGIADELVEVIGHPGWVASDLRPSSTKPCKWRCVKPGCTGRWEATPDQRTRRKGTGKPCPVCHPPRRKYVHPPLP